MNDVKKPSEKDPQDKKKKKFEKPVLTVKPISSLVNEVYAGWTPCSGDYHSTAFHGT